MPKKTFRAAQKLHDRDSDARPRQRGLRWDHGGDALAYIVADEAADAGEVDGAFVEICGQDVGVRVGDDVVEDGIGDHED